MKALKRLFLIAATILCCQVYGYDDYSDSKRPYEFGFSIDGQQHRHEKKDNKGIIMGEFGFITADDVYHVTVYATDENGRFKILSMKNIHLKSTPANRQGHSLQLPSATPSPTLPKRTSLPPRQPAISSSLKSNRKSQNNVKSLSIEPPANSCSHCSLPTTSTVAPKPVFPPSSQASPNVYNAKPSVFSTSGANGIQSSQGTNLPSNYPMQQNTFGGPSSSGIFSQNTPKKQSNSFGTSFSRQPPLPTRNPYNSIPVQASYPQQSFGGPQQAKQSPIYNLASPINSQKLPGQPTHGVSPSNNAPPYNLKEQNGIKYPVQTGGQAQGVSGAEKYPPVYPQSPQLPGAITPSKNIQPPTSNDQAGLTGPTGPRTPKQFSGPKERPTGSNQQSYPTNVFSGSQSGQTIPKKPILMSAQIQIVDKNTDIHSKRPGEKSGLPEGLNENDMMHLLYTFNYTLGFQAHYEEGYTNGFKQGYYYVTGRNGVRTRIDYTADDTGFHPKISQDLLDLLSDDVPKPETEKDAKYGLRGYEFKWLYYPVEHKSR